MRLKSKTEYDFMINTLALSALAGPIYNHNSFLQHRTSTKQMRLLRDHHPFVDKVHNTATQRKSLGVVCFFPVNYNLYTSTNSQLAWPLNKKLENTTHIGCDFLTLSTVDATTPPVLYIAACFFPKSNKMNYVYYSFQVKRVGYTLQGE